MQAKRVIVETDRYGHLLHQPDLPPNSRLEAIFLLDEKVKAKQTRRNQ
jgi:hypothetical protein